jgi:hypothetical protein
MLPNEKPILVGHADAARDIVGWVQGVTYDEFCNNEMLHCS